VTGAALNESYEGALPVSSQLAALAGPLVEMLTELAKG
jgi:hypothetical protein